MLKKRIIPCLDVSGGRTVKGVNFSGMRDAGDPVALARKYAEAGADELVFLDISATNERRQTQTEWVSEVARAIDIPFTVGGGVNSVEDARRLLGTGADKVSVNSAAVKNPELIPALVENFGSQCIVLAMDVQMVKDQWKVFVNGGKVEAEWLAVDWAQRAVEMGAGEILLTAIGKDGTRSGFDLALTQIVAESVHVPVIASGGAGEMVHFEEVFTNTSATGALAASVFHDGILSIPDLKKYLKTKKIPIR